MHLPHSSRDKVACSGPRQGGGVDFFMTQPIDQGIVAKTGPASNAAERRSFEGIIVSSMFVESTLRQISVQVTGTKQMFVEQGVLAVDSGQKPH